MGYAARCERCSASRRIGLLAAVLAGLQPVPTLECAVKRTGVLEPDPGSDLVHAQVAVAQVVYRHIAAQLVLDRLVAGAFSLQTPAQRDRCRAELRGELIKDRPAVGLLH